MYVSLNAWTNKDGYWGVYAELLKALQKKLEEHNVELAAPLQEIKLDGASSDDVTAQLPAANPPHPEAVAN